MTMKTFTYLSSALLIWLALAYAWQVFRFGL